ncbi:MAG: sortase [Blautia sp.]|nr:sortase [Blautia sp.]
MKRNARIVLILVAVISFGIALSYPVMYEWAAKKNNDTMEDLSKMREQALNGMKSEEPESSDGQSGSNAGLSDDEGNNADEGSDTDAENNEESLETGEEAGTAGGEESSDKEERDETTSSEEPDTGSSEKEDSEAETSEKDDAKEDKTSEDESDQPDSEGKGSGKTSSKEESEEETSEKTSSEDADSSEEEEEPEVEIVWSTEVEDYMLDYVPGLRWRQAYIPEYEEHDAPMLVGRKPKATNRSQRKGALSYNQKKKIKLDKDKILPELKDIYDLNNDLVGWIVIEDTQVDYPVVQRPKDNEYYLHHDFFGNDNENGQIIMDAKCDPYTPSYNLVISGHHMRNGSMFGGFDAFKEKDYWEAHKIVTFDTLMRRGTYVIMAAFNSADYDEYEEGFRYNADLRYKIDVDMWLDEVEENALYDTGITAEFGDEFVTLTTCDRSRRRDGRFVLICRRVREGEVFK